MTFKTVIQGVFTHLKLCFATATHNFKWVKINHILFSLYVHKGGLKRPNISFFIHTSDKNDI